MTIIEIIFNLKEQRRNHMQYQYFLMALPVVASIILTIYVHLITKNKIKRNR